MLSSHTKPSTAPTPHPRLLVVVGYLVKTLGLLLGGQFQLLAEGEKIRDQRSERFGETHLCHCPSCALGSAQPRICRTNLDIHQAKRKNRSDARTACIYSRGAQIRAHNEGSELTAQSN